MKRALLYGCLCISVYACQVVRTTITHPEYKLYYEKYKVDGGFILLDEKKGTYHIYHDSIIQTKYLPASTFKICNSLISLQTGVIKNEYDTIPWDGIQRQNELWNQDHTLATAFQHSTVWFYQELAFRVGGKQMKYWLEKCHYGNADTSGGITRFWLQGGLRITAREQIDFLEKLHHEKLPFNKQHQRTVKNIMVAGNYKDFTLRAKTGWCVQDGKDIGWYVGYIQTADNVYYFANCIQDDDENNQLFGRARLDIVFSILYDLKIIPDQQVFK